MFKKKNTPIAGETSLAEMKGNPKTLGVQDWRDRVDFLGGESHENHMKFNSSSPFGTWNDLIYWYFSWIRKLYTELTRKPSADVMGMSPSRHRTSQGDVHSPGELMHAFWDWTTKVKLFDVESEVFIRSRLRHRRQVRSLSAEGLWLAACTILHPAPGTRLHPGTPQKTPLTLGSQLSACSCPVKGM